MAIKTRRVGALDRAGRGCVVDQEIPETGGGMLLVEVHASLISPGTELVSAKQNRARPADSAATPKPFGYQNAGIVLETGAGVSAFKPGDRVACLGARYALHADYAVVPQNLCTRLPDNVSFEEGSFAHLAMTSLNAVRRGQPELGEYLLVVGLGLVGQMAARLGQLAGAYVMGRDTLPFRVEIARKCGIDAAETAGPDDGTASAAAFTGGLGFDLAVLAIGGEGTEALQGIRRVMKTAPDGHAMGRICLVGGAATQCQWGAALGNLDLRCCARTGPGYHDKAWESGGEYPRALVRWHTRTNMELVLRLISEGKLPVGRLVTHCLPLERLDEAVTAHLERPGETLGTVLLYDHPRPGKP